MFGIGSRTFYAVWRGIVFEFEAKRDRDYFIAHGARYISAYDVYRLFHCHDCVRVESSCKLGANAERKRRIKNWYENKRHNIQC